MSNPVPKSEVRDPPRCRVLFIFDLRHRTLEVLGTGGGTDGNGGEGTEVRSRGRDPIGREITGRTTRE